MKQKTLKNPLKIEGIGLHSGRNITMTLLPAGSNTGIIFYHKPSQTSIPALWENVSDTRMCTTISKGDISIGTIEHLMSALCGLDIDNCVIEIDGNEVPILDGSSYNFVQEITMFHNIREQKEDKKYFKIKEPIIVEEEDKKAGLYPISENMVVEVSIDFPHEYIGKNNKVLIVEPHYYSMYASKSRTFGFYKDVEQLKSIGLAKGGNFNNAIVLDDNGVMNKHTCISRDDFVYHKIIDAVGDLYTCGYKIQGFFYGYKSGHALHNKLLKTVFDYNGFEIVS